ncbi:MAG: hypothetical protein AAB724_01150 [Patescibacteria group bacterium]
MTMTFLSAPGDDDQDLNADDPEAGLDNKDPEENDGLNEGAEDDLGLGDDIEEDAEEIE